MAASYPGAVKTFTDKVQLVDLINAADVNDAYAEIEAIEIELGIDPAGTFSTVVLRLDDIETDIDTLEAGGGGGADILEVHVFS